MTNPVVVRLRFGARVNARTESYDLGAAAPCWFEVRDRITNVLTDATGIAVVVFKADGTVLDPAPSATRESLGTYFFTVTPDQPGSWTYRATITGPTAAVDQREFTVVSDTPAPAVIGPTAILSIDGQTGPTVTTAQVRIPITRFGGVAGASDNSAAWASLIDHCTASPGLIAYLPAGTWDIPEAPGEIPEGDDNQVMVPAITNAYPLVIEGDGKGVTVLRAKVAARTEVNDAPVSWPILRVVGGAGVELRNLTLDGGVRAVPATRALTLSSPGDNGKALHCCTMFEVDSAAGFAAENVEVIGYYGHRDNTEWEADPADFRGARAAGLVVKRVANPRVRNLTLGSPSFREGVYFLNCTGLDMDGFRYAGAAADQAAATSHALSTPLNVFGPEMVGGSCRNFRLWNHAGSAVNIGGVGDFRLTDGVIGGDTAGLGDGIDAGDEHQAALFADHPTLARIIITRVFFRGCSRYSLRCYKEDSNRALTFMLNDLAFENCYQGPEFSNVDDVQIGSISVKDAFYRDDYEVSGRGLFLELCNRVSVKHATMDGSGGDGVTDAMRYGIYIDRCKQVALGTSILTDLTHGHLVIYQPSTGTAEGDSAAIDVGTIIATQTLDRDATSIFKPIHLGRSGKAIAGLSVGSVLYNGTPALEQPGIMFIAATGLAIGVSRDVRGQPNNPTAYRDVLHRQDIINGDLSGAYGGGVRGRQTWRSLWTNGRGAALEIETSDRDDVTAPALSVLGHGGILVHDTSARTAAATRRAGEIWQSGGTFYACSASGTVFDTQLSGVTATADGTTTIVVSSATGIFPSYFLTVGGALREVLAVSGTSVTLDATVTAGTGLAVLYAVPTIKTITLA